MLSKRGGIITLLAAATLLAVVSASPSQWWTRESSLPRQLITACPETVSATKSCLDNLDVSVTLFTRANPTTGELLEISSDNLATTNFNPENPTKYIIHGWRSEPTLDILVDLKKAYLTRGKYNVLAVDWRLLTVGGYNCYPTSIHNARHAGKCIAYQIQRLRKKGIEDIHVVAMSLGAQVAAYIADHLRPYRLPRITGLDVALPLYYNKDRNAQLDTGDAVFVDAIHTNAFVQGQAKQIGHVDFYMNDGSNQPGCSDGGCSHTRSCRYFTESVNSAVGFWGSPCSSYLAFLKGHCPVQSPGVLMGEDVDQSSRGFVHVVTKASSPFALGQWNIFSA